MKKITTLLTLAFTQIVFICSNVLLAQCPIPAFNFGSGAVSSVSGTTVVLETCMLPDEYCTATNVQAGTNYAVNYSGGNGDFVVVYDNTFTPIAWGISPVIFTALSSGTFYSSCFIGTACGSDFTCNQIAWTTMFPGTTVNASACSNYTWALNNQTYTNSGLYLDSVSNGGGYDYYYLNLTIQNLSPANIVVTSNPSNALTVQSPTGTYQWIDCQTNLPIVGETNQTFAPTQTGSYAVIVSNGNCADTSTCTNVFIPTYEYITSCNDYTWSTSGQTYSTSGTYNYSTPVLGGTQLDYLVLDIVFEPIDLMVTSAGNILTSQSTTGTYQWIDCSTNLPIAGATNPSFEPTQSGNYAVIISDASCEDTSACTVIQGVGLEDWNSSLFSIVPNPTDDFVTLSFNGNQAELIVTDLHGKIILSDMVTSGDQIDLSAFSSGVYFFNLIDDGRNEILKMIRE